METAGLVLATAAFVGTHLALSHPLRLRLVQNTGEAGFAALYSIVAILTLGAMVLAYWSIRISLPMWIAPGWWWPVASALMLVASILLVGSLFGNPALPMPGGAKRAMQAPRGVFAITRHPMNWSFALWALVHISLSWSPRNLIVATGILILAIAGSIGQDRKKRSTIGKAWLQWEARTSFVPFAALLFRKTPWRSAFPGWVALGGGLLLWLLATWLHAPSVSRIVTLAGGGLD
ncbi:MFS transporter [Sphingosinicella sp. BN140058]|nr:NnrU family protein [Sphingosinicella sp. BN140058]QAY79743.1 MFS transporter [Sphingosinicella sp. BN140058]